MKKNYIISLQDENADLKSELQQMKEDLQDIREYLQSSKFSSGDDLDGYVNIQDVMNRLPR